MYDKAIIKSGGTLESVPEFYKNQNICSKAVDTLKRSTQFKSHVLNLSLNAIRFKKCVIKLPILIFPQ